MMDLRYYKDLTAQTINEPNIALMHEIMTFMWRAGIKDYYRLSLQYN
jgi:hypothetical protein